MKILDESFALAKSSAYFFALLFVCIGPFVINTTVQARTRSFSANVVRIVDGDTIEIFWKKKVWRVRIWGIDTPEWDQPYSSESKAETRELLTGQSVEIIPKDIDRYGRIVAVVIVNQKNISEELIRSGLAWVHIYYCKEPVCTTWKVLQRRAMDRHQGLWHDPHPVPPWQWKREHKR